MYTSARLAPLRSGYRLVPSTRWLCAAVGALVFSGHIHGQTAPTPAAPAHETPTASARVDSNQQQEERVILPPFVVAPGAIGYHGLNTMSGTRLNTKLADLASSTTVITKEQMEDFAMLDINDIFNYEANTEGTGNYTALSLTQNGTPIDEVQGNPQSANRIRGLGAPSISLGGFEMSGLVPIDPLAVDAIEINRGPNSSVFGIGGLAGSVNSVPASANLTRNRTSATTRVDSSGGYRGTLDINHVLKPSVLAVRSSMVVQRDGYELKPSGMNTVRLNGMVQYRPFERTNIKASYLHYQTDGNRPNVTTPQTSLEQWLKDGSPSWDPVTRTVKANGRVVGTFSGTPSAYFQTRGYTATISTISTDPMGSPYWTIGSTSSSTNPSIAAGTGQYMVNRNDETYAGKSLVANGGLNPPVTSKDIYDWSELNISAPNYYNNKAAVYNVLLEQNVFNTQRNSLDLQLGWLRENTQKKTDTVMGVTSIYGPTLYMDPQERRFDGSPNPYFGRPFLSAEGIIYYKSFEDRDTYRAQVAYKLDLRQESGALRWLGMHRVSGFGEQKDYRTQNLRWAPAIVSNHAWLTPGTIRTGFPNQGAFGGLNKGPNMYPYYYNFFVGDAQGADIDYAPTRPLYGDYRLAYGNASTGFTNEPVTLGPAIYAGTNGGTRTLQKVQGVVLQSYLLKDRLVATFGLRQDRQYIKNAIPIVLEPDGINLNRATFGQLGNDWTYGEGTTRTSGIVAKPLKWLSIYANRSDSFLPSPYATDLYLSPLGNATGKGDDYGLVVNFFEGKLALKINRYKTVQAGARNGNSAIYAVRMRRIDFDIPNYNVNPNLGDTYNLQRLATGWVQDAAAKAGQTLSPDQITTRVASIMGLSKDYFDPLAGSISASDTISSSGTEIEFNYAPSSSLTMKLNLAEQQVINEAVSPSVFKWYAERLAVWAKIIDPNTGQPWYTSRYGSNTTTASSFAAGSVIAPLELLKSTVGQIKPQVRRYRVNYSANFRLAAVSDNKYLKNINMGGSVRWEDRAAIGYYAVNSAMINYDPTRPVYGKANVYSDLLFGYKTTVFSVKTKFQLNIRNILENGRLQAVGAYPDGAPSAYRIVDPRQFILSATFDF
jgi:outer membrane receptor protein involved in Fe transport